MSTIRTRKGKKIILPSEAEDAEINRQATRDGTLHSDEELGEFVPFEQSALPEAVKVKARRGRPPKAARKIQTTIRLSPEVVAWFRATGKGWQSRLDEVLREYVAKSKSR